MCGRADGPGLGWGVLLRLAETPLREGGPGPGRAGGTEVAGAEESLGLQPPGFLAVTWQCLQPPSAHTLPQTQAKCRPAPPPLHLRRGRLLGWKVPRPQVPARMPRNPGAGAVLAEVAKVKSGTDASLPPPGAHTGAFWGRRIVLPTSSLCPEFAAGGASSPQVPAVDFPPRLGESKHRWGLPGGNGLRGGLVGECPAGTSRGSRGLTPRPTTFSSRVSRDLNLGPLFGKRFRNQIEVLVPSTVSVLRAAVPCTGKYEKG